MSFKVTILYPSKDDTTFNMKYFRENHVPRAEKIYKPMGLLKWELIDAGPRLDGQKQPFGVISILTFKDRESWVAAGKNPDLGELMNDVPNYCNTEPIFIGGELIASG